VRLRDDEKNLPQGAALMRVPTGPFLFLLPFASPAVAQGFVVFSDQSAGWENRALSLERDFIDAVARAAPDT